MLPDGEELHAGYVMDVDFDDFEQKKKKTPAYKKPTSWVKCLDCRAIYSDRVWESMHFLDCRFCGGANWSGDK